MRIFHGKTGAEVYRKILNALLISDDRHVVRGEEMHSEFLGTLVHIEDSTSLDFCVDGRPRNWQHKYCEALWDLGPSDRIEILQNFSKFITKFVSDQPEEMRDTVTWAYGPTIFKELPKVARHLWQDPHSRRAVIVMPRDLRMLGTPPCLTSLQFFVRDNLLHCIANMRSNDIWLGFPLDVFQFGLMQHVVASYMGMSTGSYIHCVGSLHLYERDVQRALAVIEADSSKDITRHMGLDQNGIEPLREIETGRVMYNLLHLGKGFGLTDEMVMSPFSNFYRELAHDS